MAPDETTYTHRPRPGIRDVAREAGVGVATVSRALNGQPEVSEERRQHILAVAKALGYQQNTFARGLISGKSALVGVVANEFNPFNGGYYTRLLHAMGAAARERHLELLVNFPDAPGMTLAACQSFERRGIATGAIVVSPTREDEEGLAKLQGTGFAVVVVNPAGPHPALTSIAPANTEGADAATQHLLALGHRRIGLLVYLSGYSPGEERVAGYERALREGGLPVDPALVACELSAEEAIHRWFDTVVSPTAIVCFNDDTAYRVAWVLAGRGLHVPEDVSLVGFGDAAALAPFGGGLTTVRQPVEAVGEGAVRMLTELAAGERAPGTYLRLATRLVIRGSTAPPAR